MNKDKIEIIKSISQPLSNLNNDTVWDMHYIVWDIVYVRNTQV